MFGMFLILWHYISKNHILNYTWLFRCVYNTQKIKGSSFLTKHCLKMFLKYLWTKYLKIIHILSKPFYFAEQIIKDPKPSHNGSLIRIPVFVQVNATPDQLQFFGFFPWIIIQRITLPLCVFFRLVILLRGTKVLRLVTR